MNKIHDITPSFYDTYLPEQKDMESGILYISNEYRTALHLCACGCSMLVVTPWEKHTNQFGWKLTIANNSIVSLTPSIGNYRFKCKSHYYIKANKIVWL